MKIKLTSVYVNDQEKALALLYRSAGLREKADFSQGPFRLADGGLIGGPGRHRAAAGAQQQPAAKAYQPGHAPAKQPAAMFFTDDVQADYERMKARGAEFTMPPKDVTASKIAMLNDTCGNVIQVTQLMRWQG